MVVLNGNIFGTYCTVISLASIVLNGLFLVVTRLKRVEGFQEVLVFMQNIAIGYALMSICMIILAPQTVVLSTSLVFLPRGLGAHFDSAVLNAIASFGFGCYLYTVLNFVTMFLFRYNVTCKTSSLSTVFSRRNILAFLCTAGIYSAICASLFYYSTVDSKLLVERINRTKDLGEFDILPQFDSLFSQSRETQQNNMSQITTPRTPLPQEESGNNQQGQQGQQMPENLNLRTINVFGYDYTRNPMILFSAGIFTVSNVLSSIVILIASMVVAFKLRGHQTNMSDKSQEEHQQLTKVLILDAYIPVILAIIPPINLAVCYFRHDCLTIQEFVGVLVFAFVPLIFPLLNIVLVLICMYWRKKRNAEAKEKIQNAANAQEDLNEDQIKALNTISKKK
ncbi:hypothetical protein M3Y97_00051500 [Aphelenchoides bicaudatus]|nr:hypothetical protein M3Y97_00051500 [Aphelenchoides bicaudatus]